jgi:hypothetical protein
MDDDGVVQCERPGVNEAAGKGEDEDEAAHGLTW